MTDKREMTALHLCQQVQSSHLITLLILYQIMGRISSPRRRKCLRLKLSITLDTLTARILKLSSDSQSRIEPAPFYSWWNTTDCRADSAVAPVAHEISPDHRF